MWSVGFGAGGCSSEASAPVEAPNSEVPARFQGFVEQFERERLALGIPGAAVAILERGELSFAHGFGTKGIDSRDPIRPRTIFRIGSMGKVVTAIGAMSAVDEGRLDLDAPIRDSIPDLALQGDEVDQLTLRMLLSQQSGLSDFFELPGPHADSALAEFTSGSKMKENVSFINPPGVFWNYSNPNFYIAGRAIETATGAAYRDAIQSRVFDPLGMERSFFLGVDVVRDGDYTHGYGVLDASLDSATMQDIPPDAYENAWARPAGVGFSNVLDWARMMQFLMRGDENVLSEVSRHEITSSQISTHTIYSNVRETALSLADDYGLGVGVGDGFFMDREAEPQTYYDLPFIAHGGDIPGFATTYAVLPSTGFAIVVLSNRDIERPVGSIRFALEQFGSLPAPTRPPAGREVDPSRFPQYAGQYRDAAGSDLTIRVEDGALIASGPSLDAAGIPYEPVLQPTSLDNFHLWLTLQGQRLPLEVTFLGGEAGEPQWFRSRLAVAKKED